MSGSELPIRCTLNLRWHGGGVQRDVEAVLYYFAVHRPGYRLIQETTKKNHEWGHGGESEILYTVEDNAKAVVLAIRVNDRYGTSSDDSDDYDLGTTVTISSSIPLEDLDGPRPDWIDPAFQRLVQDLQRKYDQHRTA